MLGAYSPVIIILFFVTFFLAPFTINYYLARSRGKSILLMLFLTLLFSWIVTLILAFMPITNHLLDKKITTLLLNIAFVLFGGAILFILFNAPKETTAKLPKDSNHSRFQEMGKKEAEKFCTECHIPEGVSPLPDNHPPKYRCLFCHKRD